MGIELDPDFRLQVESVQDSISLPPTIKGIVATLLKMLDEHTCKVANGKPAPKGVRSGKS